MVLADGTIAVTELPSKSAVEENNQAYIVHLGCLTLYPLLGQNLDPLRF